MSCPCNKLILIASLLTTLWGCTQPEELPTASNRAELTYVGSELVPFNWNRPLVSGERLFLQGLRYRQCPGGSSPLQIYGCTAIGIDKFMTRIGNAFSATALESNITPEDALEVEVISTAGPSAKVRFNAPSGLYLRLQNDPFTTGVRFSRFIETPNQAEASIIFLQGQAYGPSIRPNNTEIKYYWPGDPATSVGCGFMAASGSGWTIPMNLYCGQEWKSGSGSYLDAIHGVWLKPAKTSFNLAQWRPTKQSSTYNTAGQSFYAVDGNTDGYFNSSVTHTEADYQAFWEVDLQSVQRIGRVLVHNRKDCCSERSGSHVGLIGMRERGQSLGGQVQVSECKSGGTQVYCRLPLLPLDAEAATEDSSTP